MSTVSKNYVFQDEPEYRGHDACFSQVVKETADLFAQPDVSDFRAGESATSQLTRHIKQGLKSHGWQESQLAIRNIPAGLADANYKVDWQKIVAVDNCSHTHLISMELAFDNRQSIPANIFKLEIASLEFQTRPEHVALGILVTASKAGKESGGWNGAVGPSEEYDFALARAYGKSLKTNFCLISIS